MVLLDTMDCELLNRPGRRRVTERCKDVCNMMADDADDSPSSGTRSISSIATVSAVRS